MFSTLVRMVDGNLLKAAWANLCWVIWKTRNNVIFENKAPNLKLINSLFYSLQRDSEQLIEEKKYHAKGRRTEEYLMWKRPISGWVKINVDGAANGCPGTAAVGVIARNSDGRMLGAIANEIGIADALLAEATALVEGCKLAIALNCDSVLIESDSKVVVEAFLKTTDDPWRIAHLLEEARHLSSFLVNFRLSKIFRESNFAADGLAKFAINSFSCFWKSSVPTCIQNLILNDLLGRAHARLVPD